MRHTLYLLAIALMVLSCKQEKNTGTPEPETVRQDQSRKTYDQTPSDEPQFIENDSLIRQWTAELEMISTAEERFEVEEELRENRHVEQQKDTVKTLKLDESTLRIYTTTGLYALESAEIRNEELALDSAVKVGMTRDQLERVLDAELQSDIIEVGNMTRNMHFTFYFEDDRVQRIEFNGYVD